MNTSRQIIESILEAKSSPKVDKEELLYLMRGWNSFWMRWSKDVGPYPIDYTGNFHMENVEEMGRGIECQLFGHFTITARAPLRRLPYHSVKPYMQSLAIDLIRHVVATLPQYQSLEQIESITGERLKWQEDTTEFDFIENTDGSGTLDIRAMFLARYPRITNR